MLRRTESTPLTEIEARILRFGPLTSAQIKQHFGASPGSNLCDRLNQSKVLRQFHKTRQKLLWYHIDGRKPEGVTE